MSLPGLVGRHRIKVEGALANALSGDGSFLPILRYAAGVDDEDSVPKRLRPALVLFVSEELGGDEVRAAGAAVAIELVHSFSLVHDDIQDGDVERRGRETVWRRFGVPQAINAGDALLALGFRSALRAGAEEARALVEATGRMVDGQMKDVAWEGREVGVDDCLGLIDEKTGALFRCAFELGAITAYADPSLRSELAGLGADLGRAFQIQDDLLDVWGASADLRSRKATLPVACAWARASAVDRGYLGRLFASRQAPSDEEIQEVRLILERSGAREEAEWIARGHLGRARDRVEQIPFTSDGRDLFGELLASIGRLR